MPGQYVPNTTCVQHCPVICWGDCVSVTGSVWRRVLLNVPYIPAFSCHCCSNPATRSGRRFRLCHWRHCILIILWDWWQELKRIIHSPLSFQRGRPLQSGRSGSLAHGRMHLPGQQWPWLWDVSARTATSSAAGLALSSPARLGHLQFRFLGAKKIERYLAVVKVVMITQSHSSKQGQLVHWPETAPIMSLSGLCCSLTDIISSLSGTARLSPFPCTLGWMLFCYQIVQASPAPCSLCISMV